MWVSAILIDWDKRRVYGKLHNHPVRLTNVKCGDSIMVEFDQIEDILVENM